MLAATRRFAKSWFAAIIIGLLVISFGIFGFNSDVFNPTPRDSIVSAGSRSVSGAQFRQMFENRRRQIEQQSGQPITNEFAAENGLDRMVLQQLGLNAAMGALLEKIGLRPSPRLIARQLQDLTALFDPITGEFDKDAYADFLGRNGMTEDQFERDLSDEIASNHLDAALREGLSAPRSYAALTILYGLEQRDAGFFALLPASVPRPPAPTDAQLMQLMNENRAALTRPEMRVLSFVRFSPETLANPPVVSEEEIRKRFEYRKDTMTRPETRTLVQIPAKDAATAQTIVQRLRGGEDPAAVAKAVGVTPVVFEDKPKTAIPDRRLADAAFALAQGQVSGPIQGSLGLAVVKVTKVTPGQVPTLEESRTLIEADVRKDAAAQAVYDQSNVYDEARTGGASLAEAAKKAGAPVLTLGPVSKQGRDAQNQPVPSLDPQMLDVAFGLPEGGESELQETGRGDYYAVRVERVIASSLPPLAEVRDQLAQVWTQRQIAEALQTKASALAERLRKGESLEVVAASAGSQVNRIVGIDRRTAEQRRLPPELVGQIFTRQTGETFTAPVQDIVAIGKVEAVRPPPAGPAAQLTQLVRPQMGPSLFQDMVEAVRQTARARTKLKMDEARAREVLGLEPLAKAGEKGKAEAGK